MKLEEMADVLDGLAATLEKFLGKTALNDLRAVGNCLRQFPGENVAAFCNFVVQAKEGKNTTRRAPADLNEMKVNEFVAKIQHFLANRLSYDYPALRQMAAQIGKLKIPEIKAIGNRIECPLTGTKPVMVSALENWLTSIRLSAEQSSFTLSGAGT